MYQDFSQRTGGGAGATGTGATGAGAAGTGARAADPARFGRLHGGSAAMRQIYRMIERVAPTDSTVIVLGESGAGKEVVARTLHDRSRRSGGPFVAVNCGALPPNLIEAELFGHEKGAFTGAVRSHRGYFERAAGGTLFLDEITEMAPELQVRLLRVLETGRFTPVGGDAEVAADVRVVSATNRDPAKAVREGRLREDLMYRLAVFPLLLPPLRARGEDVVLLAERFLDALNRKDGTAKRLSPASLERIRRHAWPGNVRELQNAVQRAFILADEALEVEPGADLATAGAYGDSLQFAVGTPIAEMEREAIHATLARCAGDKRECAERLGISLKTLYNRLAEYAASNRAAVRVGRRPRGDAARLPAEAPAVA